MNGAADMPALQADKDLSWNMANQMGFNDPGFVDVIRLYNALHTDHEGGNVSAHTARASALPPPTSAPALDSIPRFPAID